MKIEQNKWVSIHYTLKDESGTILDSSVEGSPLGYIHGNGFLIVGLEDELEGKEVGDKFSTKIQPENGYGIYEPEKIVVLDREQFEFDGEIQEGMHFQMMTPQGLTIVKVIEVKENKIKIDANHELAGKVLNFDIEVVEVRDPTEEELNSLVRSSGCSGCSGNCGGCGGNCDCGEGDCSCEDGECNCENCDCEK